MSLSAISIIEQQANAQLENFGKMLDSVYKLYEETGNEEALRCYERLTAQYQGSRFFGAPCSVNNSDKHSKRPGPPELNEDTFADRVKTIVRKAAEHNGLQIETKARGHARTYIFYIDANVFCTGVDKLEKEHTRDFMEGGGGGGGGGRGGGGGQFIGHVVRMQVINDANLQLTDMAFAFEKYYSALTVTKKLSDKSVTAQEREFLNYFKSILIGVKENQNAK